MVVRERRVVGLCSHHTVRQNPLLMQHTDEVEASLEQIAAVAGLELGNPTVPSVTPSPSDACLPPEPDGQRRYPRWKRVASRAMITGNIDTLGQRVFTEELSKLEAESSEFITE